MTVVANPFVYGEVVPAAAFVNRVVELDRLVRDLSAAQKVFLISPRRYGKSSLIRRALATMSRRGALTVEVTVSSFSSYVAFLEGYARALVTTETTWERARAWLRDAVRSARAEVRPALHAAATPGAAGGIRRVVPRRAVGTRRVAAGPGGVRPPARLAQARRRTVIVALDEFQAIGGFDGGSVEHALRAAVQHQRDVGYVFAGSEPSLMERMLTPKRPFYKAGPVMRLERIPADEFAAFIDSRFARTGLGPEPGFGAAIVELAGNLPYDVQRLAHETWDGVRARGRPRRATLEDLHLTLTRLLAEHQMLFETVWQRLTLAQRAVLRAVVLEEGRALLSADARTRYRLGGPSTVQAALAALVRVTSSPATAAATSWSIRCCASGWLGAHSRDGFPIWLWYLAHRISRCASVPAGFDRRNPARKGDTLWARKKPSPVVLPDRLPDAVMRAFRALPAGRSGRRWLRHVDPVPTNRSPGEFVQASVILPRLDQPQKDPS